MNVEDIMSRNPVCCMRSTPLQEVARMMVENDCGEIPVVENHRSMKPVGVITDRDITCRTIALGKNPLELTAADCMSNQCICVTPDTSLEECCRILEDNQIRRVLVVDEDGACCGIVAQADIARHAPKGETAEVVKEVSRKDKAADPTTAPLAEV